MEKENEWQKETRVTCDSFYPHLTFQHCPATCAAVQGREVEQSCIMLLQSEAESHGD